MKIEELYPYWDEIHDQLLELLEWAPANVLDFKTDDPDARSIRQIVVHLIDIERYYIVHLAQGGPWVHTTPTEFKTRDQLAEGILITRNQTKLYIESLKPETLRAVRTIPTDGDTNTPTTNRPVAWILWQVMQHEIYHWGQIQLRRYAALANER